MINSTKEKFTLVDRWAKCAWAIASLALVAMYTVTPMSTMEKSTSKGNR